MGFESPNHTQTPNDFFDVMMADMSEVELRVTLAAIRKTFGFHKKRFRLSLSKMQKLTGLSKQGVLNGAEQAERRGTLKREQDGGVTVWVVNTVDHSGQHSRPPTSKQTIKEKNIKPVAKKRDPLFDSIAEVCQVDPATTGASIGKVKKALLKAEPPYTPEEIRTFGVWHNSDEWRKEKGPPSLWTLQEKIGMVRQPTFKVNGRDPNSTTIKVK